MDELKILPKEMQERSLSDREIVLSYADILKALDIFAGAGRAFLGWEGWAKYSDGKVGHCDYQGTTSIEMSNGQSWDEYIQYSHDLVKKTIQKDYEDWKRSEKAKEYELYFCLTTARDKEIS